MILIMSKDNNVTPISKHQKPLFFQCLSLYFKLAFFKISPEKLPYDVRCIIKAVLLYCSVNLLFLDTRSSTADIITQIIIELSLLALILTIGLKITKKPERFLQSFSALVGIGMVISLISVPIFYIFTPNFSHNQDINQTVINITVLLLMWNLAVISHILKRCFDISTLLSAAIAFNYLIVFELIIISISTGSA